MRAMRAMPWLLLPGVLLGAPVVQAQSGPVEAAFLRAAGEHYGLPAAEVAVLSRWRLPSDEIPVVLFVARRAGVSHDVVVAQRRQGRRWMEVAGARGLHAGDFHIPVIGATGSLAATLDRFNAVSLAQWRSLELSDREVVELVNVRFISGFLGISPGRVAQELGGAGGMAEVFGRLGGSGWR